ncbi:MAG: stage III sporulation protein AC [Clostridia bacterium]|nr:stage III sporulation protein AC [Clostridia bacterium]MBR6619312.1 stage III sporulation protein AC [Clostridia bacterium]
MDIALVFKIASIGLGVAVIHQVLSKSGRDEYAMLTTLAGVLVVVMMLLPHLTELLSDLQNLMDF